MQTGKQLSDNDRRGQSGLRDNFKAAERFFGEGRKMEVSHRFLSMVPGDGEGTCELWSTTDMGLDEDMTRIHSIKVDKLDN